MIVVAWDIETCPLPLSALDTAQHARYEAELQYRTGRDPDLNEEEASRLVRSTHPFLGWICCVGVAFYDSGGRVQTASWTAETPKQELTLLQDFWSTIATYPKSAQWITFNGKRFDVPFTLARSACYGLAPTRTDVVDTYPYNHKPHADLMKLWPSLHYRLGELCAHLGVETPKTDMRGSDVADAVAGGAIGRVARYCEADARATLRCWEAARPLLT